MSREGWTVHARCPHGRDGLLPFEAFFRAGTPACPEECGPVAAPVETKRTSSKRAGRVRQWVELRKARRFLRDL